MNASPFITGLAACFGLAGLAHADVLISYDGASSYVTADANFRSTATESGTGPWVYTNAFDDQTPLSPASGYTGPAFYGGYQFTSSTIQRGISRQQVREYASPTADQIFLQSFRTGGWLGSTLSLHGVYLFQQADFNDGFETGSINLDGVSMRWAGYGSTLDNEPFELNGHLVVQIGGTYYLSQTTIPMSANNGNVTFTAEQLASEQWAAYDPTASLDFDAANATYSPMELTGVTAVGIYFEEDGWNGTDAQNAAYGLGIASFQATGTAIPEPTAMGTLGAGCLACLARGRASHRCGS